MSNLRLEDYFRKEAVEEVRRRIREGGEYVLVGTGAGFVAGEDVPVIYADLARWEIQQRFRRHEVKALGIDPNGFEYEKNEEILVKLARQIVKDPTAVPDSYFEELRKFYNDSEIVAIVGFAAQMIATNNFNSVLKIDVDQRLLPIVGEFKPATWRKDIK
jgi:hypothetical protein